MMQTDIRVKAEGLGFVLKSITTFLVLLIDATHHDTPGEWALLAFAIGQFVYCITTLAIYVSHYGIKPLLPYAASK